LDVRTPPVAVDLVIELIDRPEPSLVLVARRFPPLGWALPGGFVEIGETLTAAACREAREETGLDVSLVALLGCYSDPARDPRGHTVSAVYLTRVRAAKARAGDDAAATEWVDPARRLALAFDHKKILRDALKLSGRE
jgi:8-oxo-dGTP diphosphatase